MSTILICHVDIIAVMAKHEFGRIRDQKRWDTKIDSRVYHELAGIKARLERARRRSYSMSGVISLMCDWSHEEEKSIGKLRADLDDAIARRKPQKVFQ